ncbi:MAG: PAS domain-containing sensor histidine kinase [Saprospiraceae bacterium]
MENKLDHQDIASLQLAAVIQTATDGIIIIDQLGIILKVNNAASELFGYHIDELIGRNINMLMPGKYSEKHDGYLKNYHKTGEKKIIGIGREVEGKRKNNTVFPCYLSISEVRLTNTVLYTGIVHDLTEQKQNERELISAKEKIEMYFDVANTINVVLDRQTKIINLNQKGLSFVGLKHEEVITQYWFNLILPPDETAPLQLALVEMMSGNIPLLDSFETTAINVDGEVKQYAWKNSLLTESNGDVVGLICSGIDISDVRDAEQRILSMNAELEKRVSRRTEELAAAINQLLNINKKLEFEIQERKSAENALLEKEKALRKAYEREKELNHLKSRFVSMASHEFRTPLSAILSSAELIEAYNDGGQDQKREKHIVRIRSAVNNLTSILNDFLSLSKLEEGKVLSHPVEFMFNDFCNDLLDDILPILKPGQKVISPTDNLKTVLFLDHKLLKNILLNLFSNAIKYSEQGKSIYFEFSMDEKSLYFSIRDEGIGIPSEEQEHLFTRFFRAHNVENIQGTGLGLTIVKRYLELMDGSIHFESHLGVGTIFKISLPRISSI